MRPDIRSNARDITINARKKSVKGLQSHRLSEEGIVTIVEESRGDEIRGTEPASSTISFDKVIKKTVNENMKAKEVDPTNPGSFAHARSNELLQTKASSPHLSEIEDARVAQTSSSMSKMAQKLNNRKRDDSRLHLQQKIAHIERDTKGGNADKERYTFKGI